MLKGEFVLPKPTFSQAAIALAAHIVTVVDAPRAPTQPVKADRSARSVVKPVDEPSTFERLSAALTAHKDAAGYKQVAGFVASAQVSAGEPELSAARTDAVMQGLRAITSRVKTATRVAVPA